MAGKLNKLAIEKGVSVDELVKDAVTSTDSVGAAASLLGTTALTLHRWLDRNGYERVRVTVLRRNPQESYKDYPGNIETALNYASISAEGGK